MRASLISRCVKLGIVGLTLTQLVTAPSAYAADKEKYEVGEEVENFTLRPLNAEAAGLKVVSLENYVGPEKTEKKKAVIISFFATYCEPCKRELPFLQALHTEYKDKDLLVLSISIDKDEAEVKKVQDLIAQHQLTYPVLHDRYNIVAKRYYVQKLPNLYILDENQKVTKVALGYDDNASAEILAEVRKTLGLPVSDPVPASLAPFIKSAGAAKGPEASGPAGKPATVVAKPVGGEDPSVEAAPVTKKGKRGKGKKAGAEPAKKGPRKIGKKAP